MKFNSKSKIIFSYYFCQTYLYVFLEVLATVTSHQRSDSSPNPTSNVLEIFNPKKGSNKTNPTKHDWNETETERSNIFEDSTTHETQDVTAGE